MASETIAQMYLTAAERVVLRKALDGTGFVSESELNQSQAEVARRLVRVCMLLNAGKEPDNTPVYRITPKGRAAMAQADA